MTTRDANTGPWFGLLCVGLLASVFLLLPAKYPPSILAASIALFGMLCWAMWSIAGRAAMGQDDDLRSRAIAGILLILPWALFAWMPGFGRPNEATDAQNQTRYAILLIDSLLVAAAFVMLARSSLSATGERFHSSLGFSCAIFGAPLYAVFCAMQLTFYKAHAEGFPDAKVLDLFNTVSEVLLFFGAIAGHLAAAFFAVSLSRAGLLSRGSARAIVGVVTVLLISLAVAKAVSPGWFELPLFIAAIPAVPWIMPGLIGLALLRRA